MNEETKDAKYFGARIGEKCWYNDSPFTIITVGITKDYFSVHIGVEHELGGLHVKESVKNGEGITFEAPKKKVTKTVDCWVVPDSIISPKDDSCISMYLYPSEGRITFGFRKAAISIEIEE